MDSAFFTPPDGFEETFTDGSEWTYHAHRGHNFVRVVGVLYDQFGIRSEDKILTVNATIRAGYDGNNQYRDGKMGARSRHDFERRYVPRPALEWIKGLDYRLTKGDGTTDRVWTVIHLYPDGSALLVPASGRTASRPVSAGERQYWQENSAHDTEEEN